MFGLQQLRHGLKIAQAQPAEVRNAESALANDIAERVAARVPISGGIGHFSHADAVEHDPDDAFVHNAQVYQARLETTPLSAAMPGWAGSGTIRGTSALLPVALRGSPIHSLKIHSLKQVRTRK